MRLFFATLILPCAFFLSQFPTIHACGYDWVGECSSSVHLRINGTLDSFSIAECPSGIDFDGLHLGTLQNLSLANAKAITWESCFNNVSAVYLKYRLYEQGGGAGNFQTLALDQDFSTLLGPYTTRYRSKASNIDLAAGLSIGETYVLEVYFLAEIDTIGDDFIPETTLLKNNNGQNYRLTFIYGGPQANPFVVIPTTVQMPDCHGDSNGVIGFSVWGDHTDLFYNWSNLPLNFYQQSNLAAGTYTITVTGANYSESQTVNLAQPEGLTTQFSNIQPVSCGGGMGAATVLPGGGTPPYRFLWQNGQTTATATFPNSSTYSVSISDQNDCLLAASVMIPATGAIEQNISGKICAGGVFEISGHVFQEAGMYDFTLPGPAGCDTLVHLTLSEANPAALLSSLPSNITVSCDAPVSLLCATAAPDATYQWKKDGIPATQNPCLTASAGGVYTLTVVQDGCSASQNIVSEEHLVAPILNAGGIAKYVMDCYEVDSTIVVLHAITNAVNPQFDWFVDGQKVQASDSLLLTFEGFPSSFPQVTVEVEDDFGCVNNAQAIIQITFPPLAPYPFYYFQPNLCSGLMDVDFFMDGGNWPFTVTWNDSLIVGSEFSLPSGNYEVVATDSEGCTSEFEIQIPPLFHAVVEDSPNPNWNSGSISIYVPSGWFSFLWSNGSMSSQLHLLPPGEYCVTMTDQNGCTLDTCFVVQGSVAVTTLGSEQLSLYPVPALPGDWVSLELPAVFSRTDIFLEIIDQQGQRVFAQEFATAPPTLPFQVPEKLPAGMYSVRVHTAAGEAAMGKLLIQK